MSTPSDFVPTWGGSGTEPGGATWNQPGELFGITIGPGGNCALCGNAVYCGGPQCPNGAVLPLAPDGVPMLQETFVSVIVWNFVTGAWQLQVA